MSIVRKLCMAGVLLSSTLTAYAHTGISLEGSRFIPETQIEAAGNAASAERLANCYSWGYITCPATGEIFDYDPPRCGEFTRPAARRACEAECSVTCKDSGWQQ